MDTIQDSRNEYAVDSGGGSERPSRAQSRARGKPYSRAVNWRLIRLVGASVAAGAALGAGIALLSAPWSGEHTRLALAREFRRHRPWRRNPWDKLGGELSKAARLRNALLRRNREPVD